MNYLMILLIIAFGFIGRADDFNARPEAIALKSKIEDLISRRYKEKIATQVPTELFNVDVEVTLANDNNSFSPEKQKVDPDGLTDISLGIIDSVNSDSSSQGSISGSGYQIKKIEVGVGLSEKLGAEYGDKFKEWLNKSVKAEFGKIGFTQFSQLAPIPKEVKDALKEDKPIGFDERFGHYQNLFGFIAAAIILLVSVFASKNIASKDVKLQTENALMIENMRLSKSNSGAEKSMALQAQKAKSEDNLKINANLLFDSVRDHQKKIVALVTSELELTNKALDRWFEEGIEGRKKMASMVDSLIQLLGNESLLLSERQFGWSFTERMQKDKDLSEVFRSFTSLSLDERVQIFEKAYWDLLSIKTLGTSQLAQPFSSMAQLSLPKIQKILSQQDKKVKSLAVLHLPSEKMEEVLSAMDFNEKKELIVNAFEQKKVKSQDLEVADQSMKFFIKKDATAEESGIEIQPMIPNLLACLNPLEEIQMIQQIAPGLSDQGFYLKQNYPCIAFLPEWPLDKLKSFSTGLNTNDIAILLKFLPSLSEKILPILPARTQTILKDSMNREFTEEEQLNGLTSLKTRLFSLVNDNQVNLAAIFKEPLNTVAKAA